MNIDNPRVMRALGFKPIPGIGIRIPLWMLAWYQWARLVDAVRERF